MHRVVGRPQRSAPRGHSIVPRRTRTRTRVRANDSSEALKLLASCAPEGIAVIDNKEAYDSLDAFCAEYGFDAATKQRMRDDMLATALKTDIVEFANAPIERFARGARTFRTGTHDK